MATETYTNGSSIVVSYYWQQFAGPYWDKYKVTTTRLARVSIGYLDYDSAEAQAELVAASENVEGVTVSPDGGGLHRITWTTVVEETAYVGRFLRV